MLRNSGGRKIMKIAIVIIILLIVAAILIVPADAFVRMIRRPFTGFYKDRSSQPDYIPLGQMPDRLLKITVLIEDIAYYEHRGYNIDSIREAAAINRKEGKRSRGGSTITQQLAKNIYFRFDKTYFRKLSELIIAVIMERRLGKNKILELYLNIIYYGNGVYGITDAAKYYFDKTVQDLTFNQIIMLVSIIAAPTKANPIQYPEVYERLRNRNLDMLLEQKEITQEESDYIRAYGVECPDPELRQEGLFPRYKEEYVPQINERFGPYRAEGYINPMSDMNA